MKSILLAALVLLMLVSGASQPIAHIHAHGITLGMPWTYDQSGVLQRIDFEPSPWKGYGITRFDFAGRVPDNVFHTDDFYYEVTWSR